MSARTCCDYHRARDEALEDLSGRLIMASSMIAARWDVPIPGGTPQPVFEQVANVLVRIGLAITAIDEEMRARDLSTD